MGSGPSGRYLYTQGEFGTVVPGVRIQNMTPPNTMISPDSIFQGYIRNSSLNVFSFLICLNLLSACAPKENKKETPTPGSPVILPDAPRNIVDSIRKEFPGAQPVHALADSLLDFVAAKYGITADQILLGASTCVDDIIYTKNFQAHRELKGPFHLGGLAGLPFTGISGLSAFAHHIPEDGTMMLEISPHIGYSKDKGWGYVLRPGQHDPSTCCGALMGTLQKLEKGTLKQTEPTTEDYQGITIDNKVFKHSKEIMADDYPLVAMTKITYQEAEEQILRQIRSVEIEHTKYIVIMAGVLINTDYMYTDYWWLNHFLVYDVKNKVLVEDKKLSITP